MPARPSFAKIKADDGRNVEVDRVTDDAVVVVWVCGARRTFTPAGLRQAVDNFELVSSYNDGAPVWLEDRDHDGASFACKLADGKFHANDSVSGESYSVSWAKFKTALLTRAKDA